jgi:hypothetical protein
VDGKPTYLSRATLIGYTGGMRRRKGFYLWLVVLVLTGILGASG